MTFIQQIFLAIANRMGLELTERKTESLDYFVTDNISLTATVAGRIATLVLIDSDVNVAGDNMRAKALNDILQELEDEQLKKAIEVALGTGDCLIKPYTDGKAFGYDLIPANNFRVTDSVGNKIKGCLIKADAYQTDSVVYERIEYHNLIEQEGTSVLEIKQMAFKNGTQVPMETTRWEGIEDTRLANVDKMIFGRIKCPMVNRGDLNSINGVPITYGMDKVVKNSVEAYDRFNKEMRDKETLIFADKTLLVADKREKGKELKINKGKNNLFQFVNSNKIEDDLIKEYSPQIRDASLTEGIQQNFKMLELVAGLSAGILTPPTTNFATATEMKANLQLSFAFIQAVRRQIEKCINDVIDGTNFIMNRNNITPIGPYEVIFTWSDSYIQQMGERLTALLQGEAIGAVDKSEVRAFIQNEPLTMAEEKVAEIGTDDEVILDEE